MTETPAARHMPNLVSNPQEERKTRWRGNLKGRTEKWKYSYSTVCPNCSAEILHFSSFQTLCYTYKTLPWPGLPFPTFLYHTPIYSIPVIEGIFQFLNNTILLLISGPSYMLFLLSRKFLTPFWLMCIQGSISCPIDEIKTNC